MEQSVTTAEIRQTKLGISRRAGALAIALAALVASGGCANDTSPVGCRGIDVQTTGTALVGISFDYRLPNGSNFRSATVSFGDGLSQTAESDILVSHFYPADSQRDYRLQATIESTTGEQYDCPVEPVTIS